MMGIALKEWAIICDLLADGKQAILLRKGGIREPEGPGRFELEYSRFALFPSWMHQKPDMIKPAQRDRVIVSAQEPPTITFKAIGEATRIWRVPSRAAFDRLDDLHAWTGEQIGMRFNYKPQNPLYLVAIRVSRLRTERMMTNHAEYAGCKSWVPLRPSDEVDDAGATHVMGDDAFAAIVQRVNDAFRAT